jgi:glycosyltransferase involved in cell wall biosynthesis
MSIKILVISDYRPTSSVRPEAEIFVQLASMGFEIDIMTYGDSWYCERFRQAGINVIDFHPGKKFDKAESDFIRKKIVEREYNLLHLFNSKAIINGLRASKGLKPKIVLYRGYTGNIHWYDPTAYLKFLHPRVDKIMCLAKSVEEWISHQMRPSHRHKLITINKGHSLSWYEGITPANLSDLGIPEGAFTVSIVANDRPMKGIIYFVKALSLLPPDLPIHFLMIGNGMDKPEFVNHINSSPYKEQVHLPGFRKDVLNIVAATDLFVLPSIKGEAITKAVIEAMALGVMPAISTVPGNRELVIHEQCGLIYPMKSPQGIADAILRAYKDPDFRKRMAAAAKEQIDKNFNTKDTALKVAAMYRSLL